MHFDSNSQQCGKVHKQIYVVLGIAVAFRKRRSLLPARCWIASSAKPLKKNSEKAFSIANRVFGRAEKMLERKGMTYPKVSIIILNWNGLERNSGRVMGKRVMGEV